MNTPRWHREKSEELLRIVEDKEAGYAHLNTSELIALARVHAHLARPDSI